MKSVVLNQASLRGEGLRRTKAANRGFSLIEVVIAIAVVALTFIGLIGLLGVGVATDQASSQQTVATNIAASILADLRSTPGNIPGATAGTYTFAPSSTRYGLPLPTTATATPSTPFKGLASPVLSVLYFDNSANLISLNPASVPANAAYVARVYPALMTVVGLGRNQAGMSQYAFMVRVLVSWPAQATAIPGGSLDVASEFIIH